MAANRCTTSLSYDESCACGFWPPLCRPMVPSPSKRPAAQAMSIELGTHLLLHVLGPIQVEEDGCSVILVLLPGQPGLEVTERGLAEPLQLSLAVRLHPVALRVLDGALGQV